jgi:hypothetical protein
MPWDDEKLSLDIDDWLLPVFMTMGQIEGEMMKKASR